MTHTPELSRDAKVFLKLRELAAQDKPFGVSDAAFMETLAKKLLPHGEYLTSYQNPSAIMASLQVIEKQTGLGINAVSLDMQTIYGVFVIAQAHTALAGEVSFSFVSQELKAAAATSSQALVDRFIRLHQQLRHAPHRPVIDKLEACCAAAAQTLTAPTIALGD